MADMFARHLTEHLLGLVEFIMPRERKHWAHAMRAEAAYAEQDGAALIFAAGCLQAACVELLAAEVRKSAAVLPAATAIGVPYFVHAAIDESHAWPLIWPLLGGSFAVLLSTRHSGRFDFRSAVSLGTRTGAIGGLLFVVAAAVLITASGGVTLGSRLHVLGIAALLGAGLSGFGGGATALLTRLQ